MSRRKIAWIVIALVGLLSAAGFVWSMFGSDGSPSLRAELQSRLNQAASSHRPRRDDRARGRGACRTNRLALAHRGRRRAVLQQPVSATVSARGVPRYEAHEAAMYSTPTRSRSNGLQLPAGPWSAKKADGSANTVRFHFARRGRERDQGLPGDTAGLSLQGRVQGVVLRPRYVDVNDRTE